MKINDENEKKRNLLDDLLDESGDIDTGSDTGEGEGGAGSQTGEIHFRFRDAMSLDPRDDMLPPSEIKRLLSVHKDIHKERVNKQKLTRQEREAIKAGRYGYKHSLEAGSEYSTYKTHPISSKAQFSGFVDKKVSAIPSELAVDTNPKMRDKLENRLRNRLANRQVPRFNPKFRPPGM